MFRARVDSENSLRRAISLFCTSGAACPRMTVGRGVGPALVGGGARAFNSSKRLGLSVPSGSRSSLSRNPTDPSSSCNSRNVLRPAFRHARIPAVVRSESWPTVWMRWVIRQLRVRVERSNRSNSISNKSRYDGWWDSMRRLHPAASAIFHTVANAFDRSSRV